MMEAAACPAVHSQCAFTLLPQALLDAGVTVVGKNVMDEMVRLLTWICMPAAWQSAGAL